MATSKQTNSRAYGRILIYIGIFVLLATLLVRQGESFGLAVEAVRRADPSWVAFGIMAMLMSLPATALVYMTLSPKKLLFSRTVLVQTAGFCVNKLLPSGSGAAGTSFLYLRAQKLSNVQAGSIVFVNNVLGIVGHFLLFWLLIALQPEALKSLTLQRDTVINGLGLFAAAVVLSIGLGIVLRDRLRRFTKPIQLITKKPRVLLRALGVSMLITLCYTASLYASAEAVGIHMTLTAAIVALSASILATSVVPTPGGIGAAEAGAYGGLLAFGVDQQKALAAALLFRVCTFWAPLLLGSICFAVVAKRGYLRKSS